ncbi:hypothetical protein K492DRAFT_160775 [Lichtheimia hyalospora FSU 10163]|nr:hypothetical protein K492DRAFT_160775 [Lichtheimia hyalospora FSU 10163]
MDRKIVGTCTDLEKPYFRLTSAPDPSTVRTVSTLKKTLKMLTEAWEQGHHNYTYICEQYKSLRQDLMVQHIRSKFTAKAYEHNARVALEMADLSEYHQCQTQLMYLYMEGVKGSVGEFVAYRILYLIYAGSLGELNTFVQQIKVLEENGRNMGLHTINVKHALDVREALARDEYRRFFMLYQRVPDRGAFLMDKFVDRTRIQALKMLCKAFRLGLSLSFILKELAFYSKEEMVEFFRQHGVNVRDTDEALDTKTAMPQLIVQEKKYIKVDIKGQL